MPATQDDALERAHERIGRVLCGKYRVERLVGIGGMASVFSGIHLRNASRVALKILHREYALDVETRARFLREGYAANIVDHPGTVRVHDDDTADDGSIFLVMELLEGETLEARLQRSHHKLGTSEVVTLVLDTLDVVAAAHAKGVVHRDLKPENLFLTREGRVKVLDFGIARLRRSSATRTGGGAVFGTPAFMSPEQALGRTEEVDALSDVWAIGATAFTLLTGRYVHAAATGAEMIVRSGSLPAPALWSIAPEVPAPIAAVIDRALAFGRADRWASAKAMKDALASARDAVASEASEDHDAVEEHTKVSPPSPVSRSHADPLEALALSMGATVAGGPSSTVAGMATNSDRRRARSLPRAAVLGLGAAIVAGVALFVALSTGSAPSASPGPASAAASPSPVEPIRLAPEPGDPRDPSLAASVTAAAPPAPPGAEPEVVPPARTAKATAPSSPPPRPRPPAGSPPAPKHDPLSPW